MRIPSAALYIGSVIFIMTPAFYFMARHNQKSTISDLVKADGFVFFILLTLGTIGAIIYSNFVYNKAERNWKSGVFNPSQMYSPDKLLEAYIRLGGLNPKEKEYLLQLNTILDLPRKDFDAVIEIIGCNAHDRF